MKIKPVNEKIFTPVTLEITIETKQELAALWCATNSTITALQNSVGGHRNIREALGKTLKRLCLTCSKQLMPMPVVQA